MINLKRLSGCVAGLAACWSTGALAQDDVQAMMDLGVSDLRQEIQTRYDAGLAASIDPSIVSANDNRYTWANEAKTQCGIALGFLKSSTKDEVSIGKCVLASQMMTRVPLPPQEAVVVVEQPRSTACEKDVSRLIFFEFDSYELPASAEDTVKFVSENSGACQWTNISVIGHTDRAGSDSYNETLAMNRARAVADFLVSGGVEAGIIKVDARGETQMREQTADGVRSPQNRRVEIVAN
ncbi:OmpA family protein [Allopontixanthobacter sp.]|uniref:OmpA family protein n=1 Tax=Allopontixanthobacter sp. TaxID=2906452 RepID=UPI002ABB22C6|nr:OmpA family protein [Allopontixanthobacter sp.]MDZ4307786.1 OmpA family protein [Allopontixanthobacter sp.]